MPCTVDSPPSLAIRRKPGARRKGGGHSAFHCNPTSTVTVMHASMPHWPFFIFAGLLALGMRQSRDRLVQPAAVAVMALAMLGLSLYGITAAFGTEALPVLAWATGVVALLGSGGRLLTPKGLTRVGNAVHMPGSWVPLGLMMGIFSARFGLGFATGMGADLVHEPAFIVLMSLGLGLLSGAFALRAIAVQRALRRAPVVA